MAAVSQTKFAKVIAVIMLCFLVNVAICQPATKTTTAAAAAAVAATEAVINESDSEFPEARTFAHHLMKRMNFIMIPSAFVIGVITTLLAALTVVSIKGLGVGVILLVLAIGQMLSRALPQVQATAAYTAAAPAPVPIVYSHAHTQQPVWLEKDW